MYDFAESCRCALWQKLCAEEELPSIDVSENVPILSQHHLPLGNLCVLVSLQMALTKVCAPSSTTSDIATLLQLSETAMCESGYQALIAERGVLADDLTRLAVACCNQELNTNQPPTTCLSVLRLDPSKPKQSVADFQRLIYDLMAMTRLPLIVGYRLHCGIEPLYVAHAALLVGMDVEGNVIIHDPHSCFDESNHKWNSVAGKFKMPFGTNFSSCFFLLVAAASSMQHTDCELYSFLIFFKFAGRFYESFHACSEIGADGVASNYIVQVGSEKGQFHGVVEKYKSVLVVNAMHECVTHNK